MFIKKEPLQSYLNFLFEYKDGRVYYKSWLIRKGKRAGFLNNKNGHRRIIIKRIPYLEHRIIWTMHYGDIPEGMQIDHKNEIKDDNRIENLRLATHVQNIYNSSISSRNKSGFKGVSYQRHTKKWVANIQINGKLKYLGGFSTPELASEAYKTVAKELHGEFFKY